jgi:3-hydroxyisobutyrate dehydrogenase
MRTVGGKPTIALLGAGGMMGLPMARNLARAGFTVRAWNRTREKAQPLMDEGVAVLGSAAEAAQGAGVLLTMLADADAVLDSVKQALDGSDEAPELWIQMSTIGEEGTERCLTLASELGLQLVDAPVLGTRAPAEEGKLVILAAAPDGLHEQLSPIFDALGQRTLWLDQAGAATRLKVALNTWVLTVVEGTAETLALAEGMGLDPQLVLDALADGPLDLPYLQMKGKAIMDRDFEPSFRLSLAAKDAALAERSARDHALDLPLVGMLQRRFEQAASEHPDEDMAATYLLAAPR